MIEIVGSQYFSMWYTYSVQNCFRTSHKINFIKNGLVGENTVFRDFFAILRNEFAQPVDVRENTRRQCITVVASRRFVEELKNIQ